MPDLAELEALLSDLQVGDWSAPDWLPATLLPAALLPGVRLAALLLAALLLAAVLLLVAAWLAGRRNGRRSRYRGGRRGAAGGREPSPPPQPSQGGTCAQLEATVAGLDLNYGLSELRFAGGSLLLPRVAAPIGSRLRLRVAARDVALAKAPPAGLSIHNVLPAVVRGIGAPADPAALPGRNREEAAPDPEVDVRLALGEATLWARVSWRAVDQLSLAPGMPVFALVAAAAIEDAGDGRPADRAGQLRAPRA